VILNRAINQSSTNDHTLNDGMTTGREKDMHPVESLFHWPYNWKWASAVRRRLPEAPLICNGAVINRERFE
jgi:hypothetical protein